MTDEHLDDVTAQLADVQRKLLDLPDDAFAERYALQKQQDALREQASQFREDWDAQRPTDELLAELAARRAQLKTIEDQRIDMVSQNLVCQGAWGLGGQDWDGPHRGGQALIRSHRPVRTGWVGSTGHYEDSIR